MNLDALIAQLSAAGKKKLKKLRQPDWVDPMLCVLTEDYFDSPEWIYEHKWDGERIIAYKINDTVKLMTRNKKSANESYPHIVEALKKQPAARLILDGEVVAMSKEKSDFSLLQKKMHTAGHSDISIEYRLFDILYVEHYDTTNLLLLDRKMLLKKAVKWLGPLKYTEHVSENGLAYFKHACKEGWEGLIVKKIDSTYEKGARSNHWLKFKCLEQQEFVIGGYTEPQGSRLNFGALLIGYYQDGKLMYAGKVGTGFDEAMLADLGKKMCKLEAKKSPFAEEVDEKRAHWIKPVLVAEIKFSEWTPYGKLRHPRFEGMRADKNARDVVKEVPRKVML